MSVQIMRIREEMERAAARRLQPFYIKAYSCRRLKPLRHHHEVKADAIPSQVPRLILTTRKSADGRESTKYERICLRRHAVHIPQRRPSSAPAIHCWMRHQHDAFAANAIPSNAVGGLVDETDPAQNHGRCLSGAGDTGCHAYEIWRTSHHLPRSAFRRDRQCWQCT